MSDLSIREVSNGVVFVAKLVPGSSPPTRISGLLEGMLKIKVTAPPEKGKANQCLIRFLADQLGIKKNAVSIISGQSNPVKQIQISGMSTAVLQEKLKIG